MQFTQAIAAAILAYTAVAAPAGTPTFELGTPLVQGNCEQLDTYCRTQPGANMAQCSAETAQCEDKCSKDNNKCRGVSGANMATCSAEYANCLGKNPYAKRELPTFKLGDPLVQPAPQSSSGEPVTRQTCKDAETACRTAPGANQAQCSAEKAACMSECDNSDSTCRTAPNANMSTCSAAKAQCYGFNPYEKRSDEPTSSSGEPLTRQTCKDAETACRTAPGANQAQCSAEKAECMSECDHSDSTCRTAPDANMSFCSAAKAQCYGFNPYQKKRSDEPKSSSGEPLVRQTCKDAETACRTAPGANQAQCSAEKAECMSVCDKSDSVCRTSPNANMSLCSAAKAQCYGFNPYN